jgi:pimeloyl-ACP methyl ester carboxylesterase
VALLYAGAYPERIGHLVLLSPGMGPLGLDISDAQQEAAMRRRSGEPWYQEARAAVQAAEAGDDSAETRLRYMPFFYGRWDDAAGACPGGIQRAGQGGAGRVLRAGSV